jgi:Holliday junction DNA helicase RuvB
MILATLLGRLLAANLIPMSAGRSDADRLVSADRAEDDNSFELKLRPKWLREFIGQEKA